ncbi:uncharacterized protein [Nicotiana tomentosiformis]|uniref:uncharacterized protein n=1 Tax=Nicotiana tomentosiformis TaxID=4098 RepID=UPI00388C5318
MVILKSNEVDSTTYQLEGKARRWWQAYLHSRPVGSPPLTWDQFMHLFLEKYIPPSEREELRGQLERLRQGHMSVTDYEARFSDLYRHATIILPTDVERVQRFIAGLHPEIQVSMAREAEMGISFLWPDILVGLVALCLGAEVSRVISILKARHMVKKGCLAYLAFVRDTAAETSVIDSMMVVREFSDVFSANITSMPLDQDIDFGIDLVLETHPISTLSYHMVLKELGELKEQLQELLEKGFIRPTVLPSGVPVLFVKNK